MKASNLILDKHTVARIRAATQRSLDYFALPKYQKQYFNNFESHISTKCLRGLFNLISLKLLFLKPKTKQIKLATFNIFYVVFNLYGL